MSHVSMRSSRQQRQHLHLHCESCYSVRCRARVEPAVSCPLAACRLLCGASFHLCKEEEHLLLCPSVRVPCLNAQYGCPATMPRAWRASHLRLCPASVVSCSMEWNRWPVDDTNPHNSAALQENALSAEEGQGEALDMALALADQRALYARLKMKRLYPELMEEEEEEEEGETREEEKKEKPTGEHINSVIQEETADRAEPSSGESSYEPVANGIQEAKPDAGGGDEGGARPATGVRTEKRDLCEMMFSMEKGGCAAAQANLKDPNKQNQGAGESGATGRREVVGHAPWNEGVLERLGQELSPQEFNMYLVHHGRMLLNFGQIHACTPREKDFVYGSLEPIPVQTLRSFKVPDSYRYKRRVQLYDTSTPSEERGVDTSDLVTSQDDWNSDEATATLLGYAEIEVMGHKISESKGTDGLYVDEGTQTHLFRTAPFKRKTTLAEVTAGRPLELRVQLQAESVSSRHNKGSSVFTFLCGHAFRRREFPTHYRNVHSDIQTGLSGWFEQRCPLAYLGCTYTQRRFQPSTHKATVTYDQELGSFSLRPDTPTPPSEGSLPPGTTAEATSGQRRRGVKGGGGEKSLSGLPYEVLCHMASFLDSLSLFQLALVSRLMRDVCSSQLLDRGMVTLHWERSGSSHRGGAKWRARPVWEFSHLFSAVESWRFAETPPMSAHLKVCPYYETSVRSKRVPLASMIKKQGGDSQERRRLVAQFLGNRALR